MRCRQGDLRCGEENHRYFGCNGKFTWCQCNIEEAKTKLLKHVNDENDIVVDKTRIAVMTDDGWVEGLVEYAQVVRGVRGRQHTAYHVNVETIGLNGTPPLCEMEWRIVGQEGESSNEETGTPPARTQTRQHRSRGQWVTTHHPCKARLQLRTTVSLLSTRAPVAR